MTPKEVEAGKNELAIAMQMMTTVVDFINRPCRPGNFFKFADHFIHHQIGFGIAKQITNSPSPSTTGSASLKTPTTAKRRMA